VKNEDTDKTTDLPNEWAYSQPRNFQVVITGNSYREKVPKPEYKDEIFRNSD